MGTKTVALVLDGQSGTLPQRDRVAVSAAVTQIVAASEPNATAKRGSSGPNATNAISRNR